MATTIQIKSLAEIDQAAREFIAYASASPLQSNIFAFFGQMGAGKTTFVKALCEALGVTDTVNSPTFAIVNEYDTPSGRPIYHFDFYRIKRLAEVYDMGYEDYFYGRGLCFIEWPELIEELLPEDTVCVHIEELPDGRREVTIKK
jgi:tRNA threonylcarbamoyladenosine biosynthesis protein TsaE